MRSRRSPLPRPWRAETGIGSPRPEAVELRGRGLLPVAVHLVRHHQDGDARSEQPAGERRVLLLDAGRGVHHQEHQARPTPAARSAWAPTEASMPRARGNEPAGVDQRKRPAPPRHVHLDPVARHPGHLVRDGRAPADQTVHQRGLPHVLAPDQRDDRRRRRDAGRPSVTGRSGTLGPGRGDRLQRRGAGPRRATGPWSRSRRRPPPARADSSGRPARPVARARRPRPPSPRSRRRRAARTSGDAVTKIFTSASGNTTVAMSRPSITAPPAPERPLRASA